MEAQPAQYTVTLGYFCFRPQKLLSLNGPQIRTFDGTGYAMIFGMSNQNPSSSFPSTQRDISNLKQTATDAASDIVSSTAEHASKAKGQLKALAGHVQEEGADQFDQVKGQLNTVLGAARDYVSERPLACVGVALAVGFLVGLSRRSAPRN